MIGSSRIMQIKRVPQRGQDLKAKGRSWDFKSDAWLLGPPREPRFLDGRPDGTHNDLEVRDAMQRSGRQRDHGERHVTWKQSGSLSNSFGSDFQTQLAPPRQLETGGGERRPVVAFPIEEEADYIFKVAVLGDSGVGKSTMIEQLKEKSGVLTKVSSKLSYLTLLTQHDMRGKTAQDDLVSNKIKVRMWDMAVGDASSESNLPSLLLGCQGVMLLYDVTQRGSFDHAELQWLRAIMKHAKPPQGSHLPPPLVMIVGTHQDKPGVSGNTTSWHGCRQKGRAVAVEEGRSLAESASAAFCELSLAEPSAAQAALDAMVSELYWRAVQREVVAAGLPLRLPRRPTGNDIIPGAILWHETTTRRGVSAGNVVPNSKSLSSVSAGKASRAAGTLTRGSFEC